MRENLSPGHFKERHVGRRTVNSRNMLFESLRRYRANVLLRMIESIGPVIMRLLRGLMFAGMRIFALENCSFCGGFWLRLNYLPFVNILLFVIWIFMICNLRGFSVKWHFLNISKKQFQHYLQHVKMSGVLNLQILRN